MTGKLSEGELAVAAVAAGKKATLDPVGEKGTISLPVWEVENSLVAGFRQHWVDGDNDVSEVDLSVGAGVGSQWGTFSYKRKSDGAEVEVVFSAKDLVTLLAAFAAERLAAREAS